MVSATRDNPPPQLPGRANFSLLSLQNSANRLHEVVHSSQNEGRGERKEGQGASCLTSAGKVTLAGGTTFSHVNNLSRSPETRKLERKMRAHAMSRIFKATLFLPPAILSNM